MTRHMTLPAEEMPDREKDASDAVPDDRPSPREVDQHGVVKHDQEQPDRQADEKHGEDATEPAQSTVLQGVTFNL